MSRRLVKDGSYAKSTKIQFRSIFVVSHFITLQRLLSVLISLEDPDLSFQQVVSKRGKFEQWQFQMQQYLQHEHYALWEVIKFGDSYEAPANDPSTTTTNTTSGEAGTMSGRTVTLTTEDMQKKKNDVKARTTLLLSLPDEHQLRFSKYKTARELWATILKTFSGNEPTKRTKKNLLKQQYGNFRAEGSETLEQTFTRLQVIVGQLQFMDVEVEQDDLNQKFLTSLAPEWLMHTIVWRNGSDLNTMSLDDLYNHLKVYEAEVQKKTETNTQNMAFISSAKHSKGNDEVNTASSNVPTASVNVATIDEDDMEEMDIKWNMALLSMRADKFWKKTGKKISIQGSDVAGFDKSKDWSYMANDGEDHALVADEEAPTEFALMANTSTESKVFDNSLCSKDCKKNNDSLNSKITDLTDKLFDAKNMIYHYKLALAQVECRLVEYKEREVKYIEKIRTLEFYNESNKECIETLKKKLETVKQEMEGVDGKLAGLLTASKELENLIESQRSYKNKEGLGYTAVPPPPVQLYLSSKKDLSWTGLLECADDTHNMYSIDFNNIVPHRDLTCLVVKASADECMLWHRRLGINDTASQEVKKDVSSLRYIALPNWAHDALLEFSSIKPQDHCSTEVPERSENINPTASTSNPPADHMETLTVESPIPTSKEVEEQSFIATIHQETDPALLQFCLFSCFLSQVEPKKISDALQDPSWVEAMQEELLQFKIQKVWTLVDCLKGMDVKSAFLYGTIDEEVYVMQPLGIQDPEYLAIVYKVEKAMYGLLQAPRAWYALMHEKFQMSAMGELNFFLGLQVLQKKDGIFLSQDKYVSDILKKFRYSNVRSSNTPMDKDNPWGKDGTEKMHQVTQKECHLHAVKRIFRYLKGHPKLGLWYPKDSPFDLVAYSDSDYSGATQDCKSTTEGCQFLGRRLISWQCKKQIIVATSTTKAEYVAAASCFKNPVYHSKTKHIEIRHHFIRDCFEKKLINVDHIHTDENVADLLTKPFDTGRFQYLVGAGSGTPTEPHHTPSLEAPPSSHTHISTPSLPTVTPISTAPIPTVTPFETTPLRQYTQRAKIAQSYALPLVADEPASLVRDDSQGEACPTESGFIADQDRTTIAKSSTLPHNSATRVTSPTAAQEVEINKLKEIVKLLEDEKGMAAEGSGDDAPIKGRRLDEEEVETKRVSSDTEEIRLDEGEVAAKKVSDDIEELPTVLITIDAASLLSSGRVQVVLTAAVVAPANVSISTGSGVVPTASTTISTTTPIFITTTTVTQYTRRKGKEKMVETHTPKNNKREYDQAAAELTIGKRIELISELVKYQDHHSKILKYQAQQRKSRTKKQKRDFYMAVIRNNLKVKDFKGMSFKEVKAKFKTVWEQIKGGVSKISEEEAAWLKRKGIRSEQESAKKQKTTEEVPEEVKSCDEIPKEKIKELIRLILIEEVYVEALQVKHPIIDWKGRIVGNKMHKAFPLPVTEFPLQEELPTAREERCHC
nr:hypothetical protein [Tanacetum cinerariifolium]